MLFFSPVGIVIASYVNKTNYENHCIYSIII
jgi:hypothetical protein